MSLQESVAGWSTRELGSALVSLASELAILECRWLELLAEFDSREGWRLDGQLSGVDWLVWKCGLRPRTARDKLRVAHELTRRPLVAAAFAAGRLSYSKVRAITYVTGVDEDTDTWLLKLADSGTAADLERVARHWRNLADQERDVDEYLRRWDRRRLRATRTYDAMMVIEVVVPLEEGEEVLTHLRVGTNRPAVGSAEPSRVDALMELLRAGRAHLGTPHDSSGADRYTVHAVVRVEEGFADPQLLDGTPIAPETLRRLACDCGIVRHLVRGRSEPLDIGTRTSVWTAAQRRAISRRDRGQCRFPGCWRRTCDAHHVVHYDDGGPTAVHNGCLLCPQHHTCVHERGFTITGEPNGTLRFHRPDGTVVGSTSATG